MLEKHIVNYITMHANAISNSCGRIVIRLDTLYKTTTCSIGKSGTSAFKKEGDGYTPIGIFRPIHLYYRADRVKRPLSRLPIAKIKKTDGWCDASHDPNYNRPVKTPYRASHEHLWREDHLYNLIMVLDHNQRPRIKGRGSAIFVHLAPPNQGATQGCLGLDEPTLRLIFKGATPQTRFIIR